LLRTYHVATCASKGVGKPFSGLSVAGGGGVSGIVEPA
jgi:hypothetical protein